MFLTVRPFTINGELVDPAEVDKPRPHPHYLADGRRIYTQEGTRRPPVINHWFRETLFGEVVLVGVVNGHRIILPIRWVAGVPTGDGSVAQFIGCNDGSAKGTTHLYREGIPREAHTPTVAGPNRHLRAPHHAAQGSE